MLGTIAIEDGNYKTRHSSGSLFIDIVIDIKMVYDIIEKSYTNTQARRFGIKQQVPVS